MMFKRARCCVFTVNNPTEADEELLQLNDTLTYYIIGHEEGESGTYHWQGYAQFSKALTLNQVKKFLPRAHIESVKGTQKQAIDYCKKDGHFDEYGTLKKHGAKGKSKKKYAEIKEIMLSDESTLQKVILEECENPSHIHYAQFLAKYKNLGGAIVPKEIHWYYGPTGCGKSHTVFNMLDKKSYWRNSIDLKWFDGYCGQDDVWIDDFRSSHCPFTTLIHITDKWPYKVNTKGGFVHWHPKRIFITSAYHPDDCYKGVCDEDKQQLIRRITLIKKFNVRYNADGSTTVIDDTPVATLDNDGYEASNYTDGDMY